MDYVRVQEPRVEGVYLCGTTIMYIQLSKQTYARTCMTNPNNGLAR